MGEIHIAGPRYAPGKGIAPDKEVESDTRFQAGLKRLAQKIDDEIVARLLAEAKTALIREAISRCNNEGCKDKHCIDLQH